MADDIKPAKPEDVCLWPDGEWCFRSELWQHGDRGDDFSVIPVDSDEWSNFWGDD